MATAKKGSAILMILLVITTISILALSALRINELMSNFAIQRAAYYRKKAALEALALYGIAIGYTAYRVAHPQLPGTLIKQINQWPPDTKGYQGHLEITFTADQWTVTAGLSKEGDPLQQVAVKIKPLGQELHIENWHYGST